MQIFPRRLWILHTIFFRHPYNHANRTDSVSVDSTASATYTYNPLGQRISKTTSNTTELYHYDEAGQLISVTDANGNPQREYIYFNNQPVAFITNNTIYYIHTDHLNTPQVVTDQNQQVVWMGDYQPFGKLTDTNSQTNSIELYSRFPGQYLDEETGLYYNYFRDYDPSVGRYIQSDPIGLQGGINTYAYVEGNPVKYVDPTGEYAVTLPVLGGIGEALGLGSAVWMAGWNSGSAKGPAPYDKWEENYALGLPPGGDCNDIAYAIMVIEAQIKWRISGLNFNHMGTQTWVDHQTRIKNLKEMYWSSKTGHFLLSIFKVNWRHITVSGV